MLDSDEILAKEVLTLAEAARLLGVGVPTIRRWVDSGVVIGWKLPVTGARRVLARSVVAIREAKKEGAATS